MTGLAEPLIVEVGCGSGWNGEVLVNLLRRPIRYIGLDYSYMMAAHGHRQYPGNPFVVGDATSLPLRDSSCDILISGTVLMHLVGYRDAIREGRRVTRKWCILHTVPVVRARPTTYLKKLAYGSPVVEVIYNEQELFDLIRENGMRTRGVLECYSYDLSDILREATLNRTYVCETT
jgi:ubiquinone/menaquinone biosynthesis C-methylase UbiE